VNVRRAAIATLAALAAACAPVERAPERHPSLAKVHQAHFPVGVAVEPRHLEGREGRFVAWQFNSLVAENAMKPRPLQPREGHFEFGGADRIVEFAQRHGMQVRGHTLLWHEETPEWTWREADGSAASRQKVLERLRRHIHEVVGRYRGRVQAWDVVNEVIDASREDCLRATAWLEVAGPGYVEFAFRAAHEADPAARLFINDFHTTQPAKRRCLLEVVRGLLARGVPVHGVGHQMHVDLAGPPAHEVDEAFAEVAALGLENQVTEMDMSLHGPAPRPPGTEGDLLALQAARYGELFRVFRSRRDVTSVSFWGLSDAHTWLDRGALAGRGDRPLLFDRDLEPKPAFWRVIPPAGGRGGAPAAVVSEFRATPFASAGTP
jgi:endo-1,4-beta-xylanase